MVIKCQDKDEITIHPQDEDDDHDNFVAPKEEIALNNNTSISEDELDEEGYSKPDSEKLANITVIVKPELKENIPEAHVILPIRRRDTTKAVLNMPPCGGVPKKKADTLTNKGSKIHVIWETIVPISGGNCTVKLSPGIDREQNFTALTPVDISLNKEEHFACGRKKGFESHQFQLPSDYVCDQCTLQWTWITSEGSFYSCSDIIINGNKIDDCLAKCKNGGACFNGKCLCDNDYYGEFCQYNKNESQSFVWIFIVIFLLFVLGAGALYYYFYFVKNGKTFMNPFKRPQPEKPFIESQRNPLQLTS